MNQILKIINKILNTNFGKEKVPPYPNDFIIIDFSPIALRENIRDEQNKIIYRYSLDEFGNIITKKYRYSKARLKSLIEIYNIPSIDKTKKESRFPIFAKILPSEIEYTK